jgi:hypothetical protein
VRLLFRPACSCKLSPQDLPRPSLRVLEGFDTDDESPQVKVSVDLLCPHCATPWESFAGLAYLPKKPSVITP